MKEKLTAAVLAFALLGSAGFAAVSSRDAFGAGSDVHGIPDDNPSHHPDDGDGECEKGETVIKTTPSGNRVNVPCHAGHGDDDGDDGDENQSGDSDDDDDDNDSGDDDDGGNGNGHGRGHNK